MLTPSPTGFLRARSLARPSLGGAGGGGGGASMRRRRPELDRASAPVGGRGAGAGAGVGKGAGKGAPLPTVPAGMAVSSFDGGKRPTPADAEAGQAGSAPAPHRDWRQRFIESPRTQAALRVVVAVGVGALLGDGVITPAISIVSAAEGLAVAFPALPKDGGVVLGVAVAILALLFAGQQFGTGAVAAAFSPVGVAWGATLLGLGGWNLARHGSAAIWAALSPHHAVRFFAADGAAAWRALGSLVLAVTGAEALYADLSHFDRPSITAATLGFVYPALVVNYLGQGALLLASAAGTAPAGIHSAVFWSSVPKPVFWPVWVVATAATVVASQALISASFSVVAQAIRQRFVPRLRVIHTSRTHAGQIYVPAINWGLAALAVGVVLAFRSSDRLGNAYGITVLLDMLLTTCFCSLVALTVWRLHLALVIPFFLFFFCVEGAFWSSTLMKVPHGCEA